MQNLNIVVNDRVWSDFDIGRMSNWGIGYAIETSSLRLVWRKYESYTLRAESLRLVWTKYESYILHTSAVMYTFQNLNTAVNDKVWPDFDLGRRSNWGRGVYYWKVLP